MSIAICAPLQSGRPFATTSILRPSVAGASRFSSRKATFAATRAPACRQMRATARSSGPALWARTPTCAQEERWSPMQAVEASSAATSLGSQRECEPQPAQQQDSELFARHDEVRSGGQYGECTTCAFATLGQQQRSGCGITFSAAVCEQSNAFTSAIVPSWFHECHATPPVPAKAVWTLLPCEAQDTVEEHSWVCPCCIRLPMGRSHSVHILMSINMRIMGMTLRSSTLLAPRDQTLRGKEEDKEPESQQQNVLDTRVELQGPPQPSTPDGAVGSRELGVRLAWARLVCKYCAVSCMVVESKRDGSEREDPERSGRGTVTS